MHIMFLSFAKQHPPDDAFYLTFLICFIWHCRRFSTTGAENMKSNTKCPFPFWLRLYNAHWNCHSIEKKRANNFWHDNLPCANHRNHLSELQMAIDQFIPNWPSKWINADWKCRFNILSTVYCNGDGNRILRLDVYSFASLSPLYWISVICTSRFDYNRSKQQNDPIETKRCRRCANGFRILWSENWNVGEWRHVCRDRMPIDFFAGFASMRDSVTCAQLWWSEDLSKSLGIFTTDKSLFDYINWRLPAIPI